MEGTASVSAAPTYGTAATLQYKGSASQITDIEFPATFGGSGGLIINDANGVTLNSARSCSTLTLTSGILTTTGTNLLTILNPAAASVVGGSVTSFINGPLARTLSANITTDGTTYSYPVGESGNYRALDLVNVRTGGAAPVVRVTVNGTGASTCDETTITGIAPRNWYIETTSGNFTSAYIRLTESGLTQTKVIGQSSAQSGTYSSIGGGSIGATITSTQSVNSPIYVAIGSALRLYSYLSGDWGNATTWTTDASGNTRINSRVPASTDNVTILNGRTILISGNNIQVNGLAVNQGGILDIGSTSGHNFGTVTGQGKIMLSSNTFPSGTFTEFVASSGGTFEYYNLNSVSLTPTQFTYNNLIISNYTGNAYSVFLNNGSNPTTYVINGNLSLKNYSSGSNTLYFGNSTASDNLINITVYGNFSVDAGCNVRVNNFATGHAIPNPNNNTTPYPVHSLSLYGNLTNNGSIRFTGLPSPVVNAYYTLTSTAYGGTNYGDVQVYFYRATNNTITCNGTTDFFRLIVAKGTDKTYTLEVNSSSTSNFALYAPNNQGNGTFDGGPEGYGYGAYYKALYIHYGTLKLNENINIPSLTEGGQDINIIPTAGLWINGANVSTTVTGVNGTGYQATTLYGLLRISAGQFSTGDAAGFVLGSLGTPMIQIEGSGTLDVSQMWAAGGSNLVSYIQSGGTANFRAQGENHGTAAIFDLASTNAVFTMSGGTLNFTDYNFLGGATNLVILNIQPQVGNYQVTGGTVNLNLPSGNTLSVSSAVPFYNLNVSNKTGTGTTTFQWNSPNSALTVLNDLTINSNAVLDLNTNSIALTIGHNFTLSSGGTLTPGTLLTTTFNGTGSQTFSNSGTITGNLRNLTLANTADLTLNGTDTTLTIPGNLTIGDGTTLRDNGKTIYVQGNIVNSGTHFTGSGSIELTGTAAQTISGDGTGILNSLTLNKTGGSVTVTANMTVKGNLRLAGTAGVWNILNIGSYNLLFGANAKVYSDMTTGTTFDNNRMIQTGGAVSDGGVSKTYSSSNLSFNFPIGFYTTAYYYMPHSISLTSATTYGSITTRPVNGRHPLTENTNSLSCYWKTTSTGFTGIPSDSVTIMQYQTIL
jgi:hypothetical protein